MRPVLGATWQLCRGARARGQFLTISLWLDLSVYMQ